MNTPSERRSIPLCEPFLGGNEWSYVKDCLDTGWVSSVGKYVDLFEDRFAAYLGIRHAVAAVNGTSALHVALLVAGIKPGDEVLVSTLTFIAPVNAIRYAGAWPVLMDASPSDWQMDPAKVADFLKTQCEHRNGVLTNRHTGRAVRAILPVHILGHAVDMEPIATLARDYGLIVIEDTSESLGAEYDGRKLGTYGDIACFSFNGNKLLTTGGGGMIATGNPEWAAHAKHLTTQAKASRTEVIHDEIGYNYSLTNVAAAMGCAQLERIEHHLGRKREIAQRYLQGFAGLNPALQCVDPGARTHSSWWMFTVRLNPRAARPAREVQQTLAQQGIESRPLWQPMHRSPAHADCQAWHCEQADALCAEALSLPCSVGLSESDQNLVLRSVSMALSSPHL